MITIYSTFRSFKHKRYREIQVDAINSWLQLDPKPQIIILGDDEGTKRVCRQRGFLHIPKIKVSKAGTPYVNSMIDTAEAHAENDIMLLLSGDIVIQQDTIDAAKAMSKNLNEFCACARKVHVVKRPNGQFKHEKWATWQAGDYWMHTKGFYAGMPDFLIGRHLVERWMYRWACNKNGLVDASGVISVYHQNHPRDFKPKNKERAWNREMWEKNYFEVEKWKDHSCYEKNQLYNIGINHANWVLKPDYTLVDNVDPVRNFSQEIS